jgi:hypothetical protein
LKGSYLIKIDDEIYKEIDSFQDYELTQCVAYEMAIRNHDVLEKINTTIKYFKDNKSSILSNKQECGYKFGYHNTQPKNPFCKLLHMLKNIEVLSIDWDNLKLNYYDNRIDKRLYIILEMLHPIYDRIRQFKIITDSLIMELGYYDYESSKKNTSLKVINTILFRILRHKYNPKLRKKIKNFILNNESSSNSIYEIITILDTSLRHFPKERLLVKTEDGYSLFTTGISEGLTRIYKESIMDGYKTIYDVKLKIPRNMFQEVPNNKKPLMDFINIKSIKELAEYVYIPTKSAILVDAKKPMLKLPDNNIINLVVSSSRIEPNFKRPKLNVDILQSKKIIGEIDFSLPKKVLDAYIKQVKQGLDNDSENSIKTTLEILGENFQAIDKKILKTTLVSSFFIYDYVIAQYPIQQAVAYEKNKIEKIELEKEIKKIKDDFHLDTYSKKSMIQDLKQLSKIDFEKVNIDDFLYQLEDYINIPFSTSKKQYYKISDYIKTEKYKELT